jgi:hypothetical protein
MKSLFENRNVPTLKKLSKMHKLQQSVDIEVFPDNATYRGEIKEKMYYFS